MLLSHDQFVEETTNLPYINPEEWRVGYSTYLRPYKNMNSDGFRYTTYPKKVRFFRDSITGITDPNRNSFFKLKKPPTHFEASIANIRRWSPKIFEGLIPFLRCDVEIKKRLNKDFLVDENIRGMFLIVVGSYPIGFFDKPKFQPHTLEQFFETI